MQPDNQAELDNIHATNKKHIDKKFTAGVIEHGGLIADMSDKALLQELVNEIDDLYVYLGEARLRGLL
jgi:hypothetical protein